MAKKVFTYQLSEPLITATAVKVEIDNGDGNMIIDGRTGGEPVLVCGALEYLEKQGVPTRSLKTSLGRTTLTLKAGGGGQPWFRFPWSACNGATEWHLHLNPTVSFDITAHSGGGNVDLDLAGMSITQVKADTGGGNMRVVLPDHAAGLKVSAKTGAGNVTVHIPAHMAARIHATSGLGKVIVYPRFSKIDQNTYQTADYDSAYEKVELTLSSGAGNVVVEEKISQREPATSRI